MAVPFLNLLANLQERGGGVTVRVGGNSQEAAILVESIPDGNVLEKDKSDVSNPVFLPLSPTFPRPNRFHRHKLLLWYTLWSFCI